MKRQMKKHRKLIRITSVILAVLVVSYIYLFAFSLKASPRLEANTMKFDETYDDAVGFIDANLLSNTNKLVAENSSFELYLDETTSHFYIKDKLTGSIIESNPKVEDPNNPVDSVKDLQKATISYRYFNRNGAQSSTQNNYKRSIFHPKTPASEEGHRTYKIKEVDNGFQVFYRVSQLEIDYLYFPKYLTAEQFEPVLDLDRSNPIRRYVLNAYWDITNDDGLYEARNYEGMSGIVREDLYKVFYTEGFFGEYSRERVIEENAEYGYFEEVVRFGFDIAVQVILTDDGIEIKVINESIKEYSESKLSEISLYPYFGTAISHDPITSDENTGYLVIPDGSGAILEFNNGKTSARSYSKRLYGRDYAKLPYKMPEEQEKILLPLYGMIKDDIGFAAIITEGDAMASIEASVSGVANDSYNKIYPKFFLRENEFTVLGSGWNTAEVNVWTKSMVKEDFTIEYKILTGDQNNYVGVANAYQDYLIENTEFKKQTNLDKKVMLELLGAYNSREMFLGVPYNSVRSLTNYNQARIIIEELNELGVDQLDILYNGITNGGLSNEFETKVKFESSVGSKRQFTKFENEMIDKGINVYPRANFFSTGDYNKVFESGRYSAKRIKGDLSVDFNYNIPTRLPVSGSGLIAQPGNYVINPRYYETIYEKYNKSFSFTNLHIVELGSKLTGNYDKKQEMFLQESVEYQKQLLSKVSDNQNILISEPFGYVIPYIDLVTDLPVESTIYAVLDYRVPLVQLVLSGMVNYSHKSINLSSNRDVDYQFLKSLENGANLKYTLSYKSSLELLNTEHNKYMSTEYTNWLETINTHYKVLEDNNLLKAYIVNHERIQSNVFKTTYNNGVEVFTNYNIASVTVNGNQIDPIGFYIGGGGA